jgi:hypothetical protein
VESGTAGYADLAVESASILPAIACLVFSIGKRPNWRGLKLTRDLLLQHLDALDANYGYPEGPYSDLLTQINDWNRCLIDSFVSRTSHKSGH